jgi:L-rhamnose-H+ transport protein
MNPMLLGLFLILISGFFQGTYGLGMKRFAPLSWEAFWALYAILGMMIIPAIWISLTVPDPLAALQVAEKSDIALAVLMGALWGCGALLWGFSIVQIGLSLTYGIGMSMTALSGSLGMLFQIDGVCSKPFFPYLILGTVLMVIGIAFVTYAGIVRERIQNTQAKKMRNKNALFVIALIGIFVSGIFSGLLNVGFNRVYSVAKAAVQQGASPANASLLQWIYVFAGGFVVQIIYTLFLLIKNKSYTTYKTGTKKTYFSIVLTALFWFAALALYGQGATLMGKFGSIFGWTMFISISLIVSNVWALLTSEWKNSGKAVRILLLGNIVLLLSAFVLGVSNSMQ